MTEITITGANHGVLPTLETWEWPVPAYLFLGGLVAGMMIFGAVLRLRYGPATYRRAVALLDEWMQPAPPALGSLSRGRARPGSGPFRRPLPGGRGV